MNEQIKQFVAEWIRASESVVQTAVDHDVIGGLWEQFAYEREELVAEERDEFYRLAVEMWREAHQERGLLHPYEWATCSPAASTYTCPCGYEIMAGSISRIGTDAAYNEVYCHECHAAIVVSIDTHSIREAFDSYEASRWDLPMAEAAEAACTLYHRYDWGAIASLMDSGLREQAHREIGMCNRYSQQQFLTFYLMLHWEKYRELLSVS